MAFREHMIEKTGHFGFTIVQSKSNMHKFCDFAFLLNRQSYKMVPVLYDLSELRPYESIFNVHRSITRSSILHVQI
jgi:hypothetical protein